MFNLDKQKFEFECKRCRFWNEALLGQVRQRDVVICRGCKTNMLLDDHLNEYRKTARSFQQALTKLSSVLKIK
jgi:hypothetical protein